MAELKFDEIKMTKKQYRQDLIDSYERGKKEGISLGRCQMLEEVHKEKTIIIAEAIAEAKRKFEDNMKEELRRDLVNEYKQEIIDEKQQEKNELYKLLED
jgi:hypothetical protein